MSWDFLVSTQNIVWQRTTYYRCEGEFDNDSDHATYQECQEIQYVLTPDSDTWSGHVWPGSSIYVKPTITSTYYARAEKNGDSTSCINVTVNIGNSDINDTDLLHDTACSGLPSLVTVTGGNLGINAKWYWYTGSCSGTLAGTGSSQSITLTTATTYWIKAIGSCNTTSCFSKTIIVGIASYKADSVKLSDGWKAPVHLTAYGTLGSGANWYWYTGTCGGTKVGSGNILRFNTPTVNTTYYVRAEGDCITTSCRSFTVDISGIESDNMNSGLRLTFENPLYEFSNITYFLPFSSEVTLNLYNLYGIKTANLASGHQTAGEHIYSFEKTSLPSGAYILQLRTVYGEVNRKVVILRK